MANCSASQLSRPISCRCWMLAGVAPNVAISRNRTAAAYDICDVTATGTAITPEGSEPGLGFTTFTAATPPAGKVTCAVAVSFLSETHTVVTGAPPNQTVAACA